MTVAIHLTTAAKKCHSCNDPLYDLQDLRPLRSSVEDCHHLLSKVEVMWKLCLNFLWEKCRIPASLLFKLQNSSWSAGVVAQLLSPNQHNFHQSSCGKSQHNKRRSPTLLAVSTALIFQWKSWTNFIALFLNSSLKLQICLVTNAPGITVQTFSERTNPQIPAQQLSADPFFLAIIERDKSPLYGSWRKYLTNVSH